MTKNYTWKYSKSDFVHTFTHEGQSTFDFVIPDEDNCKDFPSNAFHSVNVVLVANSCTFILSENDTFPFLNENSSNRTRYEINNITIVGNTEKEIYYPTFGVDPDSNNYNLDFGYQHHTNFILYNAAFNVDLDKYKFTGDTYSVSTYITEDMVITQPFGNGTGALYIKKGATLTCSGDAELLFEAVYLGGVLTGNFQISCDITCLTEDGQETRGELYKARVTSNASITIDKVNVTNCTFSKSITLDNIAYPERENFTTVPQTLVNVRFPEGFFMPFFRFPSGAKLHVTGPITGSANKEGYDPIAFEDSDAP